MTIVYNSMINRGDDNKVYPSPEIQLVLDLIKKIKLCGCEMQRRIEPWRHRWVIIHLSLCSNNFSEFFVVVSSFLHHLPSISL